MIHHFLELLWPDGDEALSETAVGAVEEILTLKAELRPGALGILTTSLLYYSKQQQQQKLQRLLSLVSLVFLVVLLATFIQLPDSPPGYVRLCSKRICFID